MKKLISVLLALLLLCSLGVTACADDAETLPGVYAVVNATDEDSGEDMSEELALLSAAGMTPTLTIDESGHGVLEIVGETQEMQFDFAAHTVTAGEINVPYEFDGTNLSFGNEGTYFYFSNDPSVAAKPKGVGAFRLFRMTELTQNDRDGNLAEGADDTFLRLYDAGDATLETEGEEPVALQFDFDTMTVKDGDVTYVFELEGRTLRIKGEGAEGMVFEQIDPGYVGPYVMTVLRSGEEDMSEQLALLDMMGMRPTLKIEEDGSAVMVLFGVEAKMNFDFNTMTVVGYEMSGEPTAPMAFTYDYGMLSFEQDGSYMSFGRVLDEG